MWNWPVWFKGTEKCNEFYIKTAKFIKIYLKNLKDIFCRKFIAQEAMGIWAKKLTTQPVPKLTNVTSVMTL